SESSDKANASIADKLPLAAVVIILLLISQFNSIRRPAIILLTIPMGMIGVIPGLLLAQQSFGFMTMLGVISLAGIVNNNAIVLLDRIAIELAEGRTPQDAVVEAGQRRLRPIILTTMTTIGGLIPLYLGGGSLWESMAIAIMAGLLVSTLLTLGVVPVLYALFFGISYSD
ncbi:MAG: efflux RND transporter permease subunit, partial [Myxococcota bacterium]